MNSWPRRRFRVTPLRALGAFFIVGVLFWYNLGREDSPPQPCSVPEEFTEKLHDLANRVHLVLAKLGVVHFLCFGALWGQVRIGRALPWVRKVEFCMVDTLRDDVIITKAFRDAGLSASYLYASGIYRVQEHEVGEDAPKLDIIVFEEDSVTQMVRRVGWTRRVLPPDCELSPSLQCFPPQLVIPPLPAKQFGGHLIPVPREGIELQKYHYPNDWWLEIKPTDCIESNKVATLVKIQKFYRPNKPWRHGLQRHLLPFVSIHKSRRKPPWTRHHPQHHRPIYSSHFTTVEIEFPKHIENNGWLEDGNLWTNRRFYNQDPQLIYEDNSKWIQQNNHKLLIKISRDDELENNQKFLSLSSDPIPRNSFIHGGVSMNQMEPPKPISTHNWEGG